MKDPQGGPGCGRQSRARDRLGHRETMSCSCRWFSFLPGAACGRNVWRDMPALTNEVGDHPVLFPELHVFHSNTLLTVSTRRSPGRRPTPAPTPFPHCPPDTFPYNRASMVQRFSSTGRVSAMPARRPAAIPSLPRTRHDGYTAIRQALEVQRGEYDEQRTGGT